MSQSRSPALSIDELHQSVAGRLRTLNHQYPSKRRALVELLAEADQPLSIPDLLAGNPKLAQSSLYRNLAVLELAGAVHRIVTGDEYARFELSEALSGHHHHHLICTSCGAVEDVTLPPSVETTVNRELDKLAAASGFAPTGHQMDLVGLCTACQ